MIRTILYTTLYVRNEYVITRHNMPIIYAYTAYVIFFFFLENVQKLLSMDITGYIRII